MNNKKIAIIGLTGQSIFMKLDEFHKLGETKQAHSLYIEPGGKGYNQAIACARFGLSVSYLTAVGNDEYGKVCEQYMKDENIDTYFCIKKENTAVATILTNNYGDNQVTVYKGASELLDINDLNMFKKLIDECDILLVQNEIPYDVLKEALVYAYNNNKYTILNPAPAVYEIEELIPYINLLIPNEVEAEAIFKKELYEIEIDNDLKLIVTLGSKGCIYIDKDNKQYYNANEVEAIDTTGAGDVFCAAIASQILDVSIDEAIEFATTAASLHIQKEHVLTAIPTLEQIRKECE